MAHSNILYKRFPFNFKQRVYSRKRRVVIVEQVIGCSRVRGLNTRSTTLIRIFKIGSLILFFGELPNHSKPRRHAPPHSRVFIPHPLLPPSTLISSSYQPRIKCMSDFSKIKIAPGSHVLRQRRHRLILFFLKYNHLDCHERDCVSLLHQYTLLLLLSSVPFRSYLQS